MTSRQSLLYEGYPDSYEEAHRRRATSFDGPLLTALNAYYYPSDPAKRESFIERILDGLSAGSPRELARRMAAYHSQTSNDVDSDPYRLSAPLVFDDFEPASQIEGRWRLEVHREYICIVLFVPIQITIRPDLSETCVVIRSPGPGKDWTRTVSASDCTSLINLIYKQAPEHVGKEFNNIADYLRRWSELHKIEEDAEPKLFADFFGGCLPWTYFEHIVGEHSQPMFPDPDTMGLPREMAFTAGEQSGRFLRALTANGGASALLGNWPEDSVACYMQNGHSIYLSNIGKRQGDKDETPLKYLVLYADGGAGAEPDGGGQARRTSARLSRFIGRIHEVGVARLAGLRNMKKMKEFNKVLRNVEYELQMVSPADKRTTRLRQLESCIEVAAKAVGESVYHRSLRASYYLGQLQRIADDLSIVDIAGFQDYRQFVRRNLYQSIENIAMVGRRYQTVLEQINTKNNVLNSLNLLHIQRIADVAASIIIIYYILSIPGKVSEYLTELGVGPPWPKLLKILALAMGLVAYWLLSLRVYRLTKEIDRERHGRATMMMWAARLFALPHLLNDATRRLFGRARPAEDSPAPEAGQGPP